MKRRDFFTKGFPAYVYKVGSLFVETAGLSENEEKIILHAQAVLSRGLTKQNTVLL